MTGEEPYSYQRSKKSDVSDELVNRFVIRPLAGLLVRVLYPTAITPNQVTLTSIVAGFVGAYFFFIGTGASYVAAGACVLVKDLLDSADGQLARARNQFSRFGRFLDSIGDILVNLAIFLAVAFSLAREGNTVLWLVVCFAAFSCVTLRVSYHVFYQTSFLHLQNAYEVNRTTEEIRAEDLRQDAWTLRLQRVFQFFYGWQDAAMVRLDRWSQRGVQLDNALWYGDLRGIRWSGFMGLGTENAVLALFSFVGALPAYLFFNLIAANLLWLGCILYRRTLSRRLGAITDV